MGEERGSIVGKVIQFPSKTEINKVEQLRLLNEELDRCEQMMKEHMQMLDDLNEEIVSLTNEYNTMLQRLKDLLLNG